MPKINLTCTYCGHAWQESVYTQEQAENLNCTRCGDKHLKAKQLDDASTDPFGYHADKARPVAYIKRGSNEKSD